MMANEKHMNTRLIAFAGIGAALVFVATYSVRIPLPATEGYLNLGDAVILLLSYILGPLAFFPAAVGSALGDLVAGYAQYIIPTFIIKGSMALFAGLVLKKVSGSNISLIRRILAFTGAELIMVGGYFLFESLPFMYGPAAAALSVPFNLIQGAAGILVAVPVSYVKAFGRFRES